MKLMNLKIGTRLGAGFILMLMLTFIMIVISVIRLNRVAETSENLTKIIFVKHQNSVAWEAATKQNGIRMLAVLKNDDAQAQKFFKDQMAAQSEKISELQKQVAASIVGDEEKKLFDDVGRYRSVYTDLRSNIMKMKSEGKSDEAGQVTDGKLIPALNEYIHSVEIFTKYQQSQIDKATEEVGTSLSSGRNLLIVLGVIELVLGASLGALLTFSITRPLNQAVDYAKTVASGDLTSRINTDRKDEIGDLLLALGTMNQSLQSIILEVRDNTENIVMASSEIANGNMDLSSRTEAQAGALEQTASSMEELSATVKHNADNAKNANHLAVVAAEVATRGSGEFGVAIETMGMINQSSQKIVEIIGVIDGIAFQTNILALNAAVEAARAGEQGRGFAVVASEVRNLAQRSAGAAKEIKELIVSSVARVDEGEKLVERAGLTMKEVVASINRVTQVMSEISTTSQEQSDGISQINQAISSMDDVTQQNAALVEEAAAAAASLLEQANNLKLAVSAFTLDGAKRAAPDTGKMRSAPQSAPRPTTARKPSAPLKMAHTSQVKFSAPAEKLADKSKSGGDGWEEF